LPGMSEKDVEVSITGDMLSLRGQRQDPETVEPEHYFRGERWAGRVERVFQLPIPVQADNVKASYRDGVLTVTLPKVEAVKPREINTEGAAGGRRGGGPPPRRSRVAEARLSNRRLTTWRR